MIHVNAESQEVNLAEASRMDSGGHITGLYHQTLPAPVPPLQCSLWMDPRPSPKEFMFPGQQQIF